MSRLHTDVVEVQRRDDEPAQFLWRGRLYVVREVLARWTESGGWWRTAAVQAVSSGGAAEGPGGAVPGGAVPGGAVPGGADAQGPDAQAGAQAAGPASVDDGEQDWFRVEAGAGRLGGTGVYDLCFSWSSGSWSLARVLD